MIGTREDELVAQVEHEHVCVAPVERAVKGGVSLGCENNGGPGLSNDVRGAMVSEGGFGSGDDFLSLVGKKDDKFGLLAFPGGFVESGQGVKVLGELENRVDVKPL